MNLSSFIVQNMEAILQEWEDFARALTSPSEHGMDTIELRDHAEEMLRSIATDLDTPETAQESINKSHGVAPQTDEYTAAERHAADRLSSGFTIEQLMAEYRSLRASVLRLWERQTRVSNASEIRDIIRFNEAIDQALTESVTRYSMMVQQSQNLFLAILGHDVRTPLGAISMGAQFLLLDEKLPAISHKMASRILSSNKRIDVIVADLLDFATTHLGEGIPISPSAMNLAEVCDNLVEEVRTFYPEHQIVLEVDFDMRVVWDSARISQAFSNLIANAIQHGSKTGPVTIKVNGEAEDGIVWSIHNNGDFIASEKLRTIFDPTKRFALFTAKESTPTHRHLGLGLYITREIISAHGGKIDIASNEAEGTTFTIRLPRDALAKET
jgi:signal transduction histidine kinase